MTPNEQIVKRLWELFDAREFARVKPLLHPEFVCIWQQSKERIVGADNFVTLNENYPGKWACKVKRLMSSGDIVVSEVEVSEKDAMVYAVSFFEFCEGKIIKTTEYWGDTYDAPEWRRKWVENI